MHTLYHLTLGFIFFSAIIRISPAMPLAKRCTWPLSVDQPSDTEIWLGNIRPTPTIIGCDHGGCTGSFQDQENGEISINTPSRRPSLASSSSSTLSTAAEESVILPESRDITKTWRWSWNTIMRAEKSSLIDTSPVMNINQNNYTFTNIPSNETTDKIEANNSIKNTTPLISGDGKSSGLDQNKFEKILNNNTKEGRENDKDEAQLLEKFISLNAARNPQRPDPGESQKERSGPPYPKEKRRLDQQKRSKVMGDTSQLLGWNTKTSSNSVPEERKHTNWLTGEAKYENKPGGTWVYCHDGNQNCVNQPPKGHQWDEHHWYYCHDAAAENCEPQPHGPHTARESDPALATHVPLIIKRSNEIEKVTFPNKLINAEGFLGPYETSKGVLEFDETEEIGSPETAVRWQGDLAEGFTFPTQAKENHADTILEASDSSANIVAHTQPEGRLKCDSKGCRSSEMDRLELYRLKHAPGRARRGVRKVQSKTSPASISFDKEPKFRKVALAPVRGMIRDHDKQFQSGECELHNPNPKNDHIYKRKTISPDMEKLLAKQKTQEASDAKRKAAEAQWVKELQHSPPVKQVGMSLLAPIKALEFGDPTNLFTGKSKTEELKGKIEKLKQKEAKDGAKGKGSLKTKTQNKQKREGARLNAEEQENSKEREYEKTLKYGESDSKSKKPRSTIQEKESPKSNKKEEWKEPLDHNLKDLENILERIEIIDANSKLEIPTSEGQTYWNKSHDSKSETKHISTEGKHELDPRDKFESRFEKGEAEGSWIPLLGKPHRSSLENGNLRLSTVNSEREVKSNDSQRNFDKVETNGEIKNYGIKNFKNEMETLEEELAQLKHLLTATREKIRDIVEIHIWPAMDSEPRKNSKRNLSVSNSTIRGEHDVERQPKVKLDNLKYYLTTVNKKFNYIIENYTWPASDDQESSKHLRRDRSSLDVTAEWKDENPLRQRVKEMFNDLNQFLQTVNKELKDVLKSYEWPTSDSKDRMGVARRELLGTNSTANWKQNSKSQFHNKLSELKNYIHAACDHLNELVDSPENKREEDEQSQE